MTVLINDGASTWLYPMMIVYIWNAFKFVLYDPVLPVHLMRVLAMHPTLGSLLLLDRHHPQ